MPVCLALNTLSSPPQTPPLPVQKPFISPITNPPLHLFSLLQLLSRLAILEKTGTMTGHEEEPKRFAPKVPVQLDPPKYDPISYEELAKCDGRWAGCWPDS